MVSQESKLETLRRFLSQKTDAEVKKMYTRCLIGGEKECGACMWDDEKSDVYCNTIRDEFVKRRFDENGEI